MNPFSTSAGIASTNTASEPSLPVTAPLRHLGRVLAERQRGLLLLGTIILIVLRAPSLLTHPRVWAEEGIYLTYALHHSALQTLLHLHPDSGYYLLSANLGALFSAIAAKKFGLEYVPFVTTYFSLCIQILPFAILIFGKSHLFRNRFMIAAGCALILLAPTTSGELWLNTINSMSWIGLAALIVMFEDMRGWSKRKTLFMRWMLVLFGFGGPYAVITFPLFVFSYFVYREKERLVQAGILAACCLMQFAIFMFVRHSGGAGSRLESLTLDSAIVNVFYFHVVGAFGGERGAVAVFQHLGLLDALQKSIAVPRGGPVVLAAYFCALLTALVLYSLWDRKLRSQSTLLIGMFLFFAVFTASAAAYGIPLHRYAFFPGLSVVLIFLNAASNHRYLVARAAFSVLLIITLWSGIREYRDFWISYAAGAPAWSDEVEKWRFNNAYQLQVWPSFFPRVVAWDSHTHSNPK